MSQVLPHEQEVDAELTGSEQDRGKEQTLELCVRCRSAA